MRVSLPPNVKNHNRSKTEIIQIRGPGNSAFLIEMLPSKDVYEIRFLLQNFILGKHNCKYENQGMSQFNRYGYILTKPQQDFKNSLKKARNVCRKSEVEHVYPMKTEKQLKFLCSPNRIFVTALKLKSSGFEIDSSGVVYLPKYVVALKPKDTIMCQKFLTIIKQLPNVVSIYDNIQRDNVLKQNNG